MSCKWCYSFTNWQRLSLFADKNYRNQGFTLLVEKTVWSKKSNQSRLVGIWSSQWEL